jgi:hypothetical protein
VAWQTLRSAQGQQTNAGGSFDILLGVKVTQNSQLSLNFYSVKKLSALHTFDKELIGRILVQVRVWFTVRSPLLV